MLWLLLACTPSPIEVVDEWQARNAASPCVAIVVEGLARAQLDAADPDAARQTIRTFQTTCKAGTPASLAALQVEVTAAVGGDAVEEDLLFLAERHPDDVELWDQIRAVREAAGDAQGVSDALRAAYWTQPRDQDHAAALARDLQAHGDPCGAASTWDVLVAYLAEREDIDPALVAPLNVAQTELAAAVPACAAYGATGRAALQDRRTSLDWLYFSADVDGVPSASVGLEAPAPVAVMSHAFAARLAAAPRRGVAIRVGPTYQFGTYRRIGSVTIGGLTLHDVDAVEVDDVPGDLDLVLGQASGQLLTLSLDGRGHAAIAPRSAGHN